MDSSEFLPLLYVIVMSTAIVVLSLCLVVTIKKARQEFSGFRGLKSSSS